MPITMGGLASGIQTDDIIKKLVDVEARPIKQIQMEKGEFNRKKEALRKLSIVLKNLNKSVKELYGFRATFDDKKAISSNPEILDATASNLAEKTVRNIRVLETASTHKIATDPISEKQKIKPGVIKFEVNGENTSFKFRGGTLQNLQEKISEEFGDSLNVGYVNTYDDNYVMTLESKTPGKKGEIKISGDKELLESIGLVSGEKNSGKDQTNIDFDSKFFTSYIGKNQAGEQDGSVEIIKKGKAVKVNGSLWREYALPFSVEVKKDTILEFDISYSELAEEEKDNTPFRINFGPQEKTVIKGIELESYNVSRFRQLPEKTAEKSDKDLLGIGVVTEGADRIEKIYPIEKDTKGKMEIPIGKEFEGKKISKLIFYCNDGTAVFDNAKIATPIKGMDGLQPKNIIAKSKNAVFEVDGVQLIREKNEGINDVIKGVNINLFRADKNKLVKLNINNDYEKSIKAINAFIESYNKYIDYHAEVTKAAISKKMGEYKKNKNKNGILVGDMTILRLQNSLQRVISSAYPSRVEEPIRMISEIGVSTGGINSEWEQIKKGKLSLDEDKLKKAIAKNPEGVKALFGSDNDGDNKPDNGFAFTLNNILKPYVQTGKNIISAHIDLQEESIKRADERIVRLEDHLKNYELKLRTKFASMEKSVSGSKSTGNWLKQQTSGMNAK